MSKKKPVTKKKAPPQQTGVLTSLDMLDMHAVLKDRGILSAKRRKNPNDARRAGEKNAGPVTRDFLLDLANDIYDPRSRSYMRLCDGELQNGPDPKTGKPLHCGLGELYYRMTGVQPKDAGVSEEYIVRLAVNKTRFRTDRAGLISELASRDMAAVSPLKKTSKALHESVLVAIREHWADRVRDREGAFTQELELIQDANDEGSNLSRSGRWMSPSEIYRSRACRVARRLRKAAKLLPE